MSEIIVDIPLDGDIVVEVKGIKGKSCLKEVESLAKILGQTTDLTFSNEYFQKEDDQHARRTISNR